MGPLSLQFMLRALVRLDELIQAPLTLVVGGGGAMVMAHHFPLSTADVDAIPQGMTSAEIDPHVKQIAKDLAHARALVKAGVNVKVVEDQIEFLERKGLPGCDAAIEFLDEIQDLG